MDWKDIVKSVAPVVGTALGSPIAGVALGAISQFLFSDEKASEEKIAATVFELAKTPEGLEKLKSLDSFFSYLTNQRNAATKEAEIAYQDRDSARKKEIATQDWTPKFLTFSLTAMLAYIIVASSLGVDFTDISSLVELLKMGLVMMWGYYWGSSAGSHEKNRLLGK